MMIKFQLQLDKVLDDCIRVTCMEIEINVSEQGKDFIDDSETKDQM